MARDFLQDDVAARFTDCDFLFLAADTMGARLLFNAIVHQYGIPGIQVGAKIPLADDGAVGNVFCVSRLVTPERGCLWCNGLISPGRLQAEAIPDAAKHGYAYVDDPDVVAPSVVTLNAIACAHAADDFLFHMTGLKYDDAETGWFRWNSRRALAGYDMPRRDAGCVECSQTGNGHLAWIIHEGRESVAGGVCLTRAETLGRGGGRGRRRGVTLHGAGRSRRAGLGKVLSGRAVPPGTETWAEFRAGSG